jgi:hypothetical protein
MRGHRAPAHVRMFTAAVVHPVAASADDAIIMPAAAMRPRKKMRMDMGKVPSSISNTP